MLFLFSSEVDLVSVISIVSSFSEACTQVVVKDTLPVLEMSFTFTLRTYL